MPTQKAKERVLVTGGAGYIGTHVVEQLLNAGYAVRIYDKMVFGEEPIQDLIKNKDLDIVRGDIGELAKLIPSFKDVDHVVHLAGLVGDPACSVNEEMTLRNNIIATSLMKELVKTYNIKKFVFSSSCSVYGSTETKVDETSKLNPVSLYARTKIDSEKDILSDNSPTLHPTILRFATVFGHSRRPRFDLVTNFFTAQAYNDGLITVTGAQQWRPFIHVKDIARAVLLVIQAQAKIVDRQVFNLGDDSLNITIGDLAELVKKVVVKDKKSQVVQIQVKDTVSDKRNYAVSFDKIKNILGFTAKTSLEDGIKEMYQAFKEGVYKGNYKDKIYSNLEMTKLLKEKTL